MQNLVEITKKSVFFILMSGNPIVAFDNFLLYMNVEKCLLLSFSLFNLLSEISRLKGNGFCEDSWWQIIEL